MDRQIYDQMVEWVYKQMDEKLDILRQMRLSTGPVRQIEIDEQLDRWTVSWIDGQLVRWTVRQMDSLIDEQLDRWTVSQIDGQLDR